MQIDFAKENMSLKLTKMRCESSYLGVPSYTIMLNYLVPFL